MSTVSRSGMVEVPLFGPCSSVSPKSPASPLKSREVTLFAPFNGISGARLALERAGLVVKKHYISEIDPYSNQITMKHFPDSIQMGDVTKWKNWDLHDMSFGIDFMIFGSPCQDLSIAKNNREGLEGSRSGLFWDALELLRTLKPKYWIMENVASMLDSDVATISSKLGLLPRRLNSQLVSAQSRDRLYWTNFPVKDIEDRGILLEDILESGEAVKEKSYAIMPNAGSITHKDYFEKSKAALVFEKALTDRDKSLCIDACYHKGHNQGRSYFEKSKRQVVFTPIKVGQVSEKDSQGSRVYSVKGKSVSISANGGGMGAKTGLYRVDLPDGDYVVRKLTPLECERAQTFPDNWTEGVSKTQRYKGIGNAFTVEIIKEIIESIPFEFE